MRKGSKWIRGLIVIAFAIAIVTPLAFHILAAGDNGDSGRTADIFYVDGNSYASFDAAVDALNALPFNGSYSYVEVSIGSSEQSEEDVVVEISKTYDFYNSVRFSSLNPSVKLVFRRASGFNGVLFDLNEVNEATSGQLSQITLYFNGSISNEFKPFIAIDGNMSETPVFSGSGYVSLVKTELKRQGILCSQDSTIAVETTDTSKIMVGDDIYGSLNYAIDSDEEDVNINIIAGGSTSDFAVDFCAPVSIEDRRVVITSSYDEVYVNVSCSDTPLITISEYGGLAFISEAPSMGSIHFLSASGDFIQCDGYIEPSMNMDYGDGEVCVGLTGSYNSDNGYENVKFYVKFESAVQSDATPESGYHYYGDTIELPLPEVDNYSFMFWRSDYNEVEYADTNEFVVESSDLIRAVWYIEAELDGDLEEEYVLTYGDELTISLDVICPLVSSGEGTVSYKWYFGTEEALPSPVESTTFSLTGKPAGSYTLYCECYVSGGENNDVYSDTMTSLTANVTINKKSLTVSPENKTITYGDAAPEYTLHFDGLCFDDDSSVLSFLPGTACEYEQGDNAGNYTISLQYSTAVPTSSNYDLSFEDGTLIVNKKTVQVPVPDQDTYTYTGEEICLDIDTGDYCSITGDFWTSVGNYESTLSLNDPDNYMWPDGTSDDISVYWSIVKQSIPVPTPVSTSYTYTGNPIFLDISLPDEIEIEGDEQTDAGNYTATLSLVDTEGYQWADGTTADKSIQWTITKATVSFTSPQTTSFTYDGTEKTLQFESSNYYSVSGNTQTFAGNYTAIVSLLDPDNYCWSSNSSEDLSVDWSIAKAKVNVPTAQADVFTYDGNEKNIGINRTDYYDVSGARATNAGSYTAVISLLDTNNYEWADSTTANKQIAWKIEKAVVGLTIPQNKLFTYTGTEQTLQFESSNYYSVSGNSATNSGNYTAIVSLTDADNYSWNDGSSEDITVDWTIGKMQIVFVAPSETTFTYSQKMTYLEIAQNSHYSVTGDAQMNAGTYTAVVSLVDTDNCEWSDGTTANKEISWSIERVTVPFTDPEVTSFTYDGTAKTLQIAASDLYTITGNSASEAGAHTAVVSLNDKNNYQWSDETSEDKQIAWSIGKIVVQFADPSVTSFVYDFESQGPAVAESNYYELSGDVDAVNAGAYTLVVSLTDKDNYEWSDGTTEDKTIEWTITKYQVEIPTITKDVFTYDGNEKNVGIESTDYYEVSGESATAAGTYSAVISLLDTVNLEWTDKSSGNKTIGWKIEKATVSFTNPAQTTFTYDGTVKTLQVAQSNYYSVTGNTGTNAGNYTATVSLTDANNYSWDDGSSKNITIGWTIGKQSIAVPVPTSTTYTYNGTPIVLSVSFTNNISLTGDVQTNAGNYTATLSLGDPDNCEWSDGTTANKEIPWTIEKATVSFTSPEVTSFSYDGTEKALQIAKSELYTVSGESATASGSYTAVISLVDKDNYQWSDETTADKSVAWSIGKITVQFTDPSETSFIYDGEEQGPGIAGSNYYSVTGDSAAVNSGSYSLTVSLNDKDNFTWADGTTDDKTITWTIAKFQVEIPTVTKDVFTYDGIEKNVGIESTDYYAVSGESATAAGTYSAVVSLLDTDNYEWTDKTTGNKTIGWKIEKATVGFIYPKTTTFTYNGTEIVLMDNSSNYFSVSDNVRTSAGSYTATISLTDKDNYSWDDGSVNDILIAWTIEKVVLSFEYPQNTVFRFDGQKKSLGIETSNYYSVTGDSAVEVGSYTAVVSILDKDNYVWSDGTAEDKSIDWSIFQNRITLSYPSVTEFTYDGNVKNLGIYSNDYYTVSGNSAENAGEYTATVTLINPNEFVWSDGSSDPVTISWKINKAGVAFSEPSVKSFTYDGREISLRIEENYNYTISGNRATNAGEYTATVTLKDRNNYCWSDGSSDSKTIVWTIEKAKLVITAMSYTISYNSDSPSYNVSARGFQGNDDIGSLGGELYTACSYTKGQPVGEYVISASGCTSDNYDIEYVEGRLTVEKAKLEKPTVSLIEFTYDGKSHNVAEKYEGQLEVVCESQKDCGTYSASLSLRDKTNYTWSDGTTEDISVVWRIISAKLVISVSDVTIHYGEEPEYGVTCSGFADGDSLESLDGSLTFICVYDELRMAGEYSVIALGLESDNYDIEYTEGTLTVLKARYDMSGVSFEDARYEYDGKEHSIAITGTLPEGVTVTYTPENVFTEAGTYEVTAVFSYDTVNYEAIEDMKAVLRITNGFVGSEEYNRIIDEVLGTKSSHITNTQAKSIYDNRISEFLSNAEMTSTIDELEVLRDDFFRFLEGFVVDLKFVPLSVFRDQYYDGDTIETGFNLVGSMYYEYDVVFVVDYSIIYKNGESLKKGDTQFTVRCSELDTVIEIPEVLDRSYYGLNVYPEYNYNARYVAGNNLPALTGTATDGQGNTIHGEFSWVGNGTLHAGKHTYTYQFVPDGENRAVFGTVELTAEKGVSTVESVRLADETMKLKYGDSLPELTCTSNVPGKITLDLGQVLTAGRKEYNFTFVPDSSDYGPCQGKVFIEVEKATLRIKARDLIIYEGDTPLFTFVYEGFVNVESSLLLDQKPVIRNIPTAIGIYTVIPEGVETDNYSVVYEESKFVIKANSYAAEIKDNEDDLVSVFRIDDNVNLSVRTKTSGFNNAAFEQYLDKSGFYMDKEELRYMYELEITDDNGKQKDVDTVVMLNIPSDLEGFCLHLFQYDGEEFEQYTNYEVSEGKIYLHLKGSTSVCLSAVAEDDVVDYITGIIKGMDIKSEEVWKIKVYYDVLSENGKKKLGDNIIAALGNLFRMSSGKISINYGGFGAVKAMGLENVITRELVDEIVNQINISLVEERKKLSPKTEDYIRKQGQSVIKALEIGLFKTVTRASGENKGSFTEMISNSDINGNIRLYIPMTGEFAQYSDFKVVYVTEDGEVVNIEASVEEIDGEKYIVFETNHFSTYAVTGTPVKAVESKNSIMMSWIIILSFTLAVCTVLAVGAVIRKKSGKGVS